MSTVATKKGKVTSETPINEVAIPDEEVNLELLRVLTPKQQRFVHLYLTGQYTPSKLAQLLDLHPNTIHNWMKRKDVQAAIADLQEGTHLMVNAQLKNASLNAMNKLAELLNSPIDGVALQAAKDILDRTGHKPRQEIKVDKTVTTVEEKLKTLIDDTIEGEFYDVE